MSDKVILGTAAVFLVLIVLVASCVGYKAGEGEQYEVEPGEPIVEPSPALAPAPEPAPAPGGTCEQLPDTGGPR